jgi:hypothetical protein
MKTVIAMIDRPSCTLHKQGHTVKNIGTKIIPAIFDYQNCMYPTSSVLAPRPIQRGQVSITK